MTTNRIFQVRIITVALLILFYGCARKCPSDVKLGSLDFGTNTKSFLPTTQQVQEMTFVSSTGKELVFKNQNPSWKKRTELGVETMCERGDFLDKTVQVAYYDTESYHLYYKTADETYSIGIDLQFNNDSQLLTRQDTIFYESFAAYSYGTGPKSANGVVSVLTSLRGNDSKILPARIDASTVSRFVSDTMIENKNLKNIYLTPEGNQRNIFLFYSKKNGLEAIKTEDSVMWWRKI